MTQTILLSNIAHYHYLASALEGAGLLKRYITSILPPENALASALLPRYWRTKLEGRRLSGVPSSHVRQIRIPEVLQKVLPRLGAVSPERANWINNHLFDRAALPLVDDCDVFHFVSSVGLYSAQKAKKNGAAVVCDVRQEHPNFQRRILEEEARRFGLTAAVAGTSYESRVLDEFALADYIIVPSQHARRTYLAEGFRAEQLPIVPYGVDLDNFGPGERTSDVFRVLYAGTVNLRKGVQYLLEAFARLRLANSELVLAGPLDPAVQPVLAKYEGLFRYVPSVPKLELRKLYADSSVFVLPSLADSFSLATLEAMACGTPVIVSENTGAADCVKDGNNGFVVPIRNSDAIAESLRCLHADSDRGRCMGLEAIRTAHLMNWTRYGERSVSLYKEEFARAKTNALTAAD